MVGCLSFRFKEVPSPILWTFVGFDDVMDKPCFDMVPIRPRMPYRLSSSGDPVIEVCLDQLRLLSCMLELSC